MSSQHITFRIWAAGFDSVETPEIGEPFFDPISRCVGVYNGPTEKILWGPRIGANHIRLRRGQGLSGTVSDGTDHDIDFDWSVKDALRIVQRSTGNVLATVTPMGTVFAASTNTGSMKFGFQNYLINSGLTRLRKNVPVNNVWTIGGGTSQNPNPTTVLVAPNWQAWMSTGVGSYKIQIDNTDLPPNGAAKNEIQVFVSPVLAGGMALRTYVHHTDELAGQTCNASAWYKMPQGATAAMRVCSMDGVVQYQRVQGSGDWVRYDMDFVVPFNRANTANNVLIFDVLYNPTVPQTSYQIASPQITLGSGVRDAERRSGEMDFALTKSIFNETKRTVNANTPATINYELSSDRWIAVEGYPAVGGSPGGLTNITADGQTATFTWTDPALLPTTPVNVLLTVHRTPIFIG